MEVKQGLGAVKLNFMEQEVCYLFIFLSMLTRKHTAWKKSRRFGDIKGGRCKLKLKDNIFKRLHSLLPPSDGDELPLFMADNPSRDFYFPVTVDEIKAALACLPTEHTEHITHVWLRRMKKADYLNAQSIQGSLTVGGGVCLITLFPFPKDNKMFLGRQKPLAKQLNEYKKYEVELLQDKKGYWLQWHSAMVKQYYLERLLLHEVGHAVHSCYAQFWSQSASVKKENFADSYASIWSIELGDVDFYSSAT